MDGDRTGILPFIWEPNYGFERYTEYALDVPMYFRYDNGEYLDATAKRTTFREFMDGKLPSAPGAAAHMRLSPCLALRTRLWRARELSDHPTVACAATGGRWYRVREQPCAADVQPQLQKHTRPQPLSWGYTHGAHQPPSWDRKDGVLGWFRTAFRV